MSTYIEDGRILTVTILLIGGSRAKTSAALAALEKHYDVQFAISGKQGIELAKAHPPRAVILDAVALGTPGERICRSLLAALPQTPILHIHPGASDGVQSPASMLLFPPITAKRLIASVERLLSVEDDEVIGCGPFHMNISRRILIAHGKETQLTPKLASLVEVFLRNPGQTIDRKRLMEKVWDTDYLGDTRTLDVHIRWIRQALEEGSRTPRYLKTVRGVGYCLDVSTAMAEIH